MKRNVKVCLIGLLLLTLCACSKPLTEVGADTITNKDRAETVPIVQMPSVQPESIPVLEPSAEVAANILIEEGHIAFVYPDWDPYGGYKTSGLTRAAYKIKGGLFRSVPVLQKTITLTDGAKETTGVIYYCETAEGIEVYPQVGGEGFRTEKLDSESVVLFPNNGTLASKLYEINLQQGMVKLLLDDVGYQELLNRKSQLDKESSTPLWWAEISSVSPDGKSVLFFTNRTNYKTADQKAEIWLKDRVTGRENVLLDGHPRILWWDSNTSFYYAGERNEKNQMSDIFRLDIKLGKSEKVFSDVPNVWERSNGREFAVQAQNGVGIINLENRTYQKIDLTSNSALYSWLYDIRAYNPTLSEDGNWIVMSLYGKDKDGGQNYWGVLYNRKSEELYLVKDKYGKGEQKEYEEINSNFTADNYLLVRYQKYGGLQKGVAVLVDPNKPSEYLTKLGE